MMAAVPNIKDAPVPRLASGPLTDEAIESQYARFASWLVAAYPEAKTAGRLRWGMRISRGSVNPAVLRWHLELAHSPDSA